MLEVIPVISIQRDEDVELDFIDIHPTEPKDWDLEF